MSITPETLYLQLHDLRKQVEFLTSRHDEMERFIKDQYPQYFAGEVGTTIDPELNPVELHLGPMVDTLISEEENEPG